MTRHAINRIALPLPLMLSALATALVLGSLAAGVHREADEGWQAHIFQLLMVAQLPAIAAFLLTADWHRPRWVLGIVGLYFIGIGVALFPVRLAGL